MADSFSFDAQVAAAATDPTAGGAVPVELPPEQQRHGVLWPTPAEMVSDHSAEGAPWLPAARAVPKDPPQGPLWAASHAGEQVGYSAQQDVDPVSGQAISAPAVAAIHDGTDGGPWDPGDWGANHSQPNAWPQLNIGTPFTLNQGSRETRTLATDQWDATGKRVSPPDAPSAPHEIYGSRHYTVPRFIPFEAGALFSNVADSNQFTVNPGYWGVNGSVPDMSPRPHGAVAAQMPTDPYVADAVGSVPATVSVDYSTDW
ncbi:MAG TPA: hypothetical protein VNV62_18650 [Trebonia sp.]|jgi:hypothetical protein|nr:hypothetical protein [Trebonia sp.]